MPRRWSSWPPPGPARRASSATASPGGCSTARPTRSTCWPSPSPGAPPASCSGGWAGSGCEVGPPPARSTAWRGPCSRSAGATNGAPDPSCSSIASGCWRRSWASWCPRRASPRCAWMRWPGSWIGRGLAWCRPSGTPRRPAGQAASHRYRPTCWPRCSRPTPTRSASVASSTSTTSSSCAPTELEHQPDFAASQRWRFRHLFVDEFQDVNPLQFRLLEAWRGRRPDLCVVGDPNQAIYGWNGADPSLLLRLPSLVGACDGRASRPAATGRRHRCSPRPRPCSPTARRPPGAGRRTRARGARLRHRARRSPRHRHAAGRAPAGPAVVVVRGAGPHPGPGRRPSSAPCASLDPGAPAARPTAARPARCAGGAAPRRRRGAARQRARGPRAPAGDRRCRGCAGRGRARRAPPAVLARARAAQRQPVGHPRDLPGLVGRGRRRRRRRGRRRRRAHLPCRQGPRVAPGRRGRRRGRTRPPPSATGVEGRAEETRLLYVAAHPCRARAPLHVGPIEGSRRPSRAQALAPARAGPRRWRRCHPRPRRRRGIASR